MNRTARVAPVVACLASAALLAQSPSPAQFRARVDVVQLDVSVLDTKTRQPVRGLTASDFTVLEDGAARKIVAFAAEDVPDPPAVPVVNGRPVTWTRDVAPEVQTNASAAAPESRLFVMVIDDAMIPMQPGMIQRARDTAVGIVDRLSAVDRMAIVLTSQSVHAQDFTTDRAKLKAAIEKIRPGLAQYYFGWDNVPKPGSQLAGPPAWEPAIPTDGDIPIREMSFGTLVLVADALMAAPERRKTLVYISTGIPVNPGWAATIKLADGSGLASYEANKRLAAEMSELFRRMQRANINIYAFDPSGLDGMAPIVERAILTVQPHASAPIDPLTGQTARPDMPPQPAEWGHFVARMDLDFLEAAAENTGGRAFVNTNDFKPGIEQMFSENGSYYLLGYEAPPNDPPGSLHRLTVRVNRPNVEVRTRSGYYTAKPDVVDPKKPVVTPMAKAVANVLPSGDLPLQVALAPIAWMPPPPPAPKGSKPPKGALAPIPPQATVTIVLGLQRPPSPKPMADTVDVQISAFTPDGFQRGAATQLATVAIRPATTDEPVRYEALSHIELKPGRYQLRIAAYSAVSDATGSVFADVEVPDFANDAVSLSGVLVERTPAVASAPRATLVPSIVPVVPTSDRTFQKLDRASAFLRVYQGGTGPLGAVTMATRLVNERDEAITQRSDVLAPESFTGPTRSADYRFEIPMITLPRGQYLLTFEAAAGDKKVKRTVRFTVK